jgi:hypothetical protein
MAKGETSGPAKDRQGIPVPVRFVSPNPPDPRIMALVRLLARRAARDWYRAQMQDGGKEQP